VRSRTGGRQWPPVAASGEGSAGQRQRAAEATDLCPGRKRAPARTGRGPPTASGWALLQRPRETDSVSAHGQARSLASQQHDPSAPAVRTAHRARARTASAQAGSGSGGNLAHCCPCCFPRSARASRVPVLPLPRSAAPAAAPCAGVGLPATGQPGRLVSFRRGPHELSLSFFGHGAVTKHSTHTISRNCKLCPGDPRLAGIEGGADGMAARKTGTASSGKGGGVRAAPLRPCPACSARLRRGAAERARDPPPSRRLAVAPRHKCQLVWAQDAGRPVRC